MSNTGRWDGWYAGLDADEPQPYGDTVTYDIAAGWLSGLHVEDWGCGKGFFRTLVSPELYTGIDGSKTPFADVITDLCTYTSETEGILLRHVLEHNERWERILSNALRSASRRIALVLFTPMAGETREIARTPGLDVPDISFCHDDLVSRFATEGWSAQFQDYQTNTQYGTERFYRLERT